MDGGHESETDNIYSSSTLCVIRNVAVYTGLQLWLIVTDFYNFYIILIMNECCV